MVWVPAVATAALASALGVRAAVRAQRGSILAQEGVQLLEGLQSFSTSESIATLLGERGVKELSREKTTLHGWAGKTDTLRINYGEYQLHMCTGQLTALFVANRLAQVIFSPAESVRCKEQFKRWSGRDLLPGEVFETQKGPWVRFRIPEDAEQRKYLFVDDLRLARILQEYDD
jgi:hypothetical protein